MAQDRVEHRSTQRIDSVLPGRFDQPDATRHRWLLGFESLGGALEHGRRRIHDRDLVSDLCQRHALVPRPATDIDHPLGTREQMPAEVLVDHMRSDATTQRRVVVVHEALRERCPGVVGGTISHRLILPDPQCRRDWSPCWNLLALQSLPEPILTA